MQYSTDTKNWIEWNGAETLSSINNVLYLRGIGNTKVSGGRPSTVWVLTGSNVSVDGNIEMLLDYETVLNGEHPAMINPASGTGCFQYMFGGFREALIKAPDLPATELTLQCYQYMFVNCSNLKVAPELPATTLANRCYSSMFAGCSSLTTIPQLPATTLVDGCYYNMFGDCSNIKLSETKTGTYTQPYRVPISGTGTTATNAITNMFNDTGGTFTGTPTINTTYYLDESNSIVPPLKLG